MVERPKGQHRIKIALPMLKAQRLIKRLHQLLATEECGFQPIHM